MLLKKNFIILLIIIVLNSCGYQVVYNNKSDLNFNIVLNKLEGDKRLNNNIKSKLNNYINNKDGIKIETKINSVFRKQTLSKDTTGKETNYELIATVYFEILYKGVNQKLIYKETIKVANIENAYEQKNYENVIKNNFADSIVEKFLLKLKTL